MGWVARAILVANTVVVVTGKIQLFPHVQTSEEKMRKIIPKLFPGGYEVRSSATYSIVPNIYKEESILPWWTWLVALILVMFSVFMVIMCCLRYVLTLNKRTLDTLVLAALKNLEGTHPNWLAQRKSRMSN